MTLAAISILSLSGFALAEGGKTTDKVFAEPKEDSALLYILRDRRKGGSAVSIFVFSDRDLVGVVPNASYSFGYLRPGLHILWWGWKTPGREIELEAGELYFLDLTSNSNNWGRLLDEQSATQLLDKIKFYYRPTENDRDKANKYITKNHAKVMALPPEVTGPRLYCADPDNMFMIPTSATIGIRPIELQCDSTYPEEVTDEWSEELPRLIARQLKRKGYGDVQILATDDESAVDILLEGTFVELKEGSGAARYFVGGPKGAAYMRVAFTASKQDTPPAAIEIECARTGYGVPGVLLGALSAGSKRIQHNSMERFAERLAEMFHETNEKKKRRKG